MKTTIGGQRDTVCLYSNIMLALPHCGETDKSEKWPYVICRKSVKNNSIQCISCNGWVNKRCSDVSHLMTVCDIFQCRTCLRGSHDNRIDRDFGMDLGNGKYLEILLSGRSINGKQRLTYGISCKDTKCWKKFRELHSLLTRRDGPLRLQSRVNAARMKSAM